MWQIQWSLPPALKFCQMMWSINIHKLTTLAALHLKDAPFRLQTKFLGSQRNRAKDIGRLSSQAFAASPSGKKLIENIDFSFGNKLNGFAKFSVGKSQQVWYSRCSTIGSDGVETMGNEAEVDPGLLRVTTDRNLSFNLASRVVRVGPL